VKTVREILTGRAVVALSEETTVLAAARAMKEHHVGAALVVDRRGQTVGIFTERDLMVGVVAKGIDPERSTLDRHMTRDVYMASPEDHITSAAAEMQRRHIRHLPVVEGDRVIALLSLRDLLREHLAIATGQVQALTAYIQNTSGEAD
jgi:signal-transduction protein with cAMP-binding, CBS, and nucleotidyltransferase domain